MGRDGRPFDDRAAVDAGGEGKNLVQLAEEAERRAAEQLLPLLRAEQRLIAEKGAADPEVKRLRESIMLLRASQLKNRGMTVSQAPRGNPEADADSVRHGGRNGVPLECGAAVC